MKYDFSDYDTAIRLKPNDAKAYNSRGFAKGELGQYAAAISDFDKAIRLKPDFADAYINRGFAKAELGRTLAAKQDIRNSLRLAIKAGDATTITTAEKIMRILNE